jgi:2-iminobutanoate/2-iminopropanoate deaminase
MACGFPDAFDLEEHLKEIILTKDAPAPIGPYSQAVRSGGLVFLSGQLPLDPASGELEAGIAAQTRRVFGNIRAVLEAGGSSLAKVLKVTVYMIDLGQFAEMNQVYASFFPDAPPARTTMQVAALPKAAEIEIDVIARV